MLYQKVDNIELQPNTIVMNTGHNFLINCVDKQICIVLILKNIICD